MLPVNFLQIIQNKNIKIMELNIKVIISDDKETIYLVDDDSNILIQASISWFYLQNPYRSSMPTTDELKTFLLGYYHKFNDFNVKKLDKVKRYPRKINGRIPKKQSGTQELFSTFSEGII